jgi:hypothetical protein
MWALHLWGDLGSDNDRRRRGMDGALPLRFEV